MTRTAGRRPSRPRSSARLRAVGVGLAAATTAVLAAAPASAGPGGAGSDTDNGYAAGAVDVQVTGDVSVSLQASVPGPPPLCYWKPLDFPGVDPSNPQAVSDYYFENVHSPSSIQAAYYYAFGKDGFADAVKQAEGGAKITWYQLEVDESQLSGEGDYYQQSDELAAAGCGAGRNNGSLVSFAVFPTGNPPEPVVDPEVLAQYAYEVMDLVEPTLQWNPQIDQLNQASLVNLETWFWVDDAEAVGERTVTATAGTVSATVTATTGGVTITSPAGTTQCSADAARTRYAPGVSGAGACTLTFTRASRGYAQGFPMAASTNWQATWTSSTGAGGELDARTAEETTYVPVVESQSVVDSVG